MPHLLAYFALWLATQCACEKNTVLMKTLMVITVIKVIINHVCRWYEGGGLAKPHATAYVGTSAYFSPKSLCRLPLHSAGRRSHWQEHQHLQPMSGYNGFPQGLICKWDCRVPRCLGILQIFCFVQLRRWNCVIRNICVRSNEVKYFVINCNYVCVRYECATLCDPIPSVQLHIMQMITLNLWQKQ